jgi:hypothetical protein
MLMQGLTKAFSVEQVARIIDTNALSWLWVNRAALIFPPGQDVAGRKRHRTRTRTETAGTASSPSWKLPAMSR